MKVNGMESAFLMRSLLLVTCLWLNAGCASTHIGDFFLPPHERSFDTTGEKVKLVMLKDVDVQARAKELGITVTGFEPAKIQIPEEVKIQAAPAAAIGAAALGFAVDFAKTQIEEEAEHYVAQFSATLAADEFWKVKEDKDGKYWVQNYEGFELTRVTKATSADKPAFRLVCVLKPSKDNRAFLVEPVYLKVERAKAKVLSFRYWSLLWGWLLRTGNEVEAEVDVEANALWVDDEQAAHVDKIAAFGFKKRYDLSSEKALTASDLNLKAGWFPGIPQSLYPDVNGNLLRGFGTFWIRINVTERDPSQAKKYLERMARTLEEKKPQIIGVVKEKK